MACNGCHNEDLKKRLGDKYLYIGNAVYEIGAEPIQGQGEPHQHNGQPIRFKAWLMSIGHSDECTRNK